MTLSRIERQRGMRFRFAGERSTLPRRRLFLLRAAQHGSRGVKKWQMGRCCDERLAALRLQRDHWPSEVSTVSSRKDSDGFNSATADSMRLCAGIARKACARRFQVFELFHAREWQKGQRSGTLKLRDLQVFKHFGFSHSQ